jgi:hypothetical protein
MADFQIVPTTELEAINYILATIGESPVNSVNDEFVDAALARDLIRQVSRSTQVRGWSFNTEYNWTFTRDVNDEVNLPANALKISIPYERHLIIRGSKIYDNYNHTNALTANYIGELVLGLNFEDTPEVFRNFVTIRAGRLFQDRSIGDGALHRISSRDEMGAWANLLNYEAEVNQWNVTDQAPNVVQAKGYNRNA